MVGVEFPLVQTTKYFRERVLSKRPYLKLEYCQQVIDHPISTEVQADGRIRFWGYVSELGPKALRVVTLVDCTTIHNAFLDRGFKPEGAL